MANTAGNPQAFLNRMITTDPRLKPVADAISAAGGDPKKAFYEMARQKGVDPQEILNMMNGQI